MKKYAFVTLILLISFIIFQSCNRSIKNREMIKKEIFGLYQDKDVFLFTLSNKAGNVLKLTNYGAKIVWIEVPDKEGKKDNITFGYDTFDETIKGDPYFGSVVGRYANRIAHGEFLLDGVKYTLALNNGTNALHGGPKGWHSVVWDADFVENTEFPAVKFTYMSPDMEEGYPGNMKIEVIYTWTDKNEIIIDYKCTTDKKTILNITNHAYFNLHGAGNGTILDHELIIKASSFIPVDSTLIPTGEIRQVSETPFDFTSGHTIGERIEQNYDQLIFGLGYDHTFVLDNKDDIDITVYDPVSGRLMEVITDQPGVQFYSGNFLDGKLIGHGGKPYNYRSGLCLETGFYPDSPNHPNFPSTVIVPRETFSSKTIYRFSVK